MVILNDRLGGKQQQKQQQGPVTLLQSPGFFLVNYLYIFFVFILSFSIFLRCASIFFVLFVILLLYTFFHPCCT